VPTRRPLPGLIAALGLLAGACDSQAPAPPAEPEPDPQLSIVRVERLAGRMSDGVAIAHAEFTETLGPLHRAPFKRWPEPELLRLVASFQHLRTTMIARFKIEDQLCAEDSFVRYQLCEAGYPCVAAVQLAELNCLWFVSH
jgi:hypothetical protein